VFRFTKLRHYPHTIGNRFYHYLANCPLTLSGSIHTILDKTIFIEHGLIRYLSLFMELTLRLSIGYNEARSVPCGAFISSTMMVIMMAITPSLNASSRLLSIIPLFVGIYPPNVQAELRGLMLSRMAAASSSLWSGADYFKAFPLKNV
jgi:hypothetical protein